MGIELETPPRPTRHRSGDEDGSVRSQTAPESSGAKSSPAPAKRSRRWAIAAGILIIVAMIAAIIIVMGQISHKMAAAAAEKSTTTSPPSPAQRVAVLELKGIPYADKLSLPGKISPWLSVSISSETNGPVVSKLIEEGQPVEKGQTLFTIDTDTLQTELELAQTRLSLAEKQLERTRALFTQNFTSREQLDEDESAVEQSQAELKLRDLMLRKATIQAPASGLVNRTYVEEGDYVREGTALCEIIQTDRLKMIVGIPEKDIIYLKEGQSVPVTVDAMTGRSTGLLDGVIHKIIPAADPQSHTFTVEVAIPEPGDVVRPGMIGRAEFTRRTMDEAILIPIFSVMRHSEGYAVFVEEEGVAKRRIITVGGFLPQGLQIETGLNPGDNLIIRGQRDLVDDEPVEIIRRIGPEVFALAAQLGTNLSNSDIENFLDEYLNEPLPADSSNANRDTR